MPNPWAPDTAGSNVREEGASEEDINEVLWVEWMIAFVRLERWKEVVELLQEEMHRMVMFLEWKLWDWLAKVETPQGNTTQDVESGLNTYARKQAAIYHNLAVSFAKLWCPTLVSYNLEHSWITEFLMKNGVPLVGIDDLAVMQGIFKLRIFANSHNAASTVAPPSTTTQPSSTALPFAVLVTTDGSLVLEEYNYSEGAEEYNYSKGAEDNKMEGSDSDFADDFADDWEDDLGF